MGKENTQGKGNNTEQRKYYGKGKNTMEKGKIPQESEITLKRKISLGNEKYLEIGKISWDVCKKNKG